MTNRSRRRRAVLLVLLIAAPALLGAAVGRAVVTAPASPPSSISGMRVIGSAALAALDRPQTATDRRAVPDGAGLVPSSVRRIGVVHSVDAVVQLARNTAGQVCLIAALRSGLQFTAACAGEADAERDGLTVQFSITGWAAVRLFSERGVLPRFVTLVWTPDGRLHLDERTDATA